MGRRVLGRLAWAALTLWGTSLIVFTLTHAIPANPVAAICGSHADAQTQAQIRRELHLDDPLWQQYQWYLGRLLHGDLGFSYVTGEAVGAAIRTRFPATLALAAGGVAVWLLLGVPLGVLTARWRDQPVDRVVLVLAMVAISVPVFWLGRLLQHQLAYRDGYLPVAGLLSWRHLILPSITLGVAGAGWYARYVHSNLIEVLNEDYILAARLKGMPEHVVLFKHALRNGLVPVLTVLGMDIAALMGGVVLTESVFALPGIGALSLQAVRNMDIPMIMGTVLFAAAMVVGGNVVVDLLYGLLDPRIADGG
jgi:peptide/nickel transport system permease protein